MHFSVKIYFSLDEKECESDRIVNAFKELLCELEFKRIFDKDIAKLRAKFKHICNVIVNDKSITMLQWVDINDKQTFVVTNKNLNNLSGKTKQAMEQFERIFVQRIGL